MEPVHECLLRRAIKVDHHIPAEDDVQWGLDGVVLVHQIDTLEPDHVGQIRFNLDCSGLRTLTLQEMALNDFWRKFAKPVFLVDTGRGLG